MPKVSNFNVMCRNDIYLFITILSNVGMNLIISLLYMIPGV